MTSSLLPLLTVLLLSLPASATQPEHSPMSTLQALASGECPPERCFDGRPILRREPPLVILEERKVSEHVRPGYTETVRVGSDCYDYGDYDHGHDGWHYDGRGRRYHGRHHGYHRRCHDRYEHRYHPPALVSTWQQTVGIEDRDRHVSNARRSGGLWGGLLGLAIGALGFLAGPVVGVALLAVGGTAGLFAGRSIAGSNAERDPKIYDRTFTTERPLPPGGPQF